MCGCRRLSSPNVPAPPVPSSLALKYLQQGLRSCLPCFALPGTPPPPRPGPAASPYSGRHQLPAVETLLLSPLTPLHHCPLRPGSEPGKLHSDYKMHLHLLPKLQGGKSEKYSNSRSYQLDYGKIDFVTYSLKVTEPIDNIKWGLTILLAFHDYIPTSQKEKLRTQPIIEK